MILIVHIIFGAAIGSLLAQNTALALLLAFLSHYFLDTMPHRDYPIGNGDLFGKNRQWAKMRPKLLRVALDFLAGILLIVLFSNGHPIIYLCGLVAAIPDSFTALKYLFPNKALEVHHKFHQKIHFLDNKNIPLIWRISTQIFIVILSIFLFKI